MKILHISQIFILIYIFTLDLIVDTVNVTFKSTVCRAFIITEMALVRLYLIVNTVNVMLKSTAARAFIITEMALVRLYLIVNTVNVNL